MTTIHSILAATDFSDDSRRAALRAAFLCKAMGVGRAGIVHAVDSVWLEALRRLGGVPAELEQLLLSGEERALDELAASIRSRTGVSPAPTVRIGKVVDTLLEESAGFDLLVLGAGGGNPVREVALGSTAWQLLRQASRPVLVVRREPAGPYREVLVAVDFSARCPVAIALADEVAPGASIALAHVFSVPFEGRMRYAGVAQELIDGYTLQAREQAQAEMRELVASAGALAGRLDRTVEHGEHPATTLIEMAGRRGSDLVVVAKRSNSTTERLLLGSVTQRLLDDCPCDVLVLP